MINTSQSNQDDLLSHPDRIAFLHHLKLLDIFSDHTFDKFTRFATRLVQTPVSLISIVESDQQLFKSAIGLKEPWATRKQMPLSHSFCKYVVLSQKPLVVEDARDHPILQDNLAIEDLDVISYMGLPLKLDNGHIPGALCVIDSQPRQWTNDDVETLRDLADLVIREIELRLQVQKIMDLENIQHTLIEEIRNKEQDLLQSESYLHSIINLQNVLILRIDLNGYYTYINDSMYERYKWLYPTKEAMIGQLSLATIIEEDHPKTIETVDACLQHPDQSFQVALRKPTENGGFFWGLWEFVASKDTDGNVNGIQCVGIDTTEQKELEHQAFQVAIEREKLNIITQFIEIVSHEFRTPLSIINLNANLLARIQPSEQTSQKVNKINRQVNRINHLLEDLLLITRIETQGTTNSQSLDLGLLLNGLRSQTSAKYQRNIHLSKQPETNPVKIFCDAEHLTNAIMKLIDNAVRYSPDTSTINIYLSGTHEFAVIEIQNKGELIDPETISQIFDIFWRNDAAHTTPGFGIGLSLAKRIVELHGGQVSVISETDTGNIFRLQFPRI